MKIAQNVNIKHFVLNPPLKSKTLLLTTLTTYAIMNLEKKEKE